MGSPLWDGLDATGQGADEGVQWQATSAASAARSRRAVFNAGLAGRTSARHPAKWKRLEAFSGLGVPDDFVPDAAGVCGIGGGRARVSRSTDVSSTLVSVGPSSSAADEYAGRLRDESTATRPFKPFSRSARA